MFVATASEGGRMRKICFWQAESPPMTQEGQCAYYSGFCREDELEEKCHPAGTVEYGNFITDAELSSMLEAAFEAGRAGFKVTVSVDTSPAILYGSGALVWETYADYAASNGKKEQDEND